MSIEEKFEFLRKKWVKETGFHSVSHVIYNNKNFREIISLGKSVIPLIIKRYMSDDCMEDWSRALSELLQVNPVKNKSYEYDKIRDDWKRYLRDVYIDEILNE